MKQLLAATMCGVIGASTVMAGGAAPGALPAGGWAWAASANPAKAAAAANRSADRPFLMDTFPQCIVPLCRGLTSRNMAQLRAQA